ncbi:MAG: molybdopterin-dependent oxidoreductase [Acidimicrobiia bacterium]|nr:molybdopterin-dependent oxidoreductase [Acidimicrobiia bacterium]
MTAVTISPTRAGFAGAIAAGSALALTELIAGITERVPSAIAAVGGIVIDSSPRFVKEFAISVFGTADKGALAIGTVIVSLLIGWFVGRASVRRPWVALVAFGAFALLGIVASLGEPQISPVLTIVAIAGSAAAGLGVLRLLLREVPESPTDALATDPQRRQFLLKAAGLGTVATVAGLGGRRLIIARSEEARQSVALPVAELTLPAPPPEAQFAAIPDLTPIVVPNDEFYRIDTALVVPRPDPESWRLKFRGMVDREVEFSLDDLMKMPLYEQYVTISCVSNEVGGDLVGNAKWTGVRLVDLLDQAGVQPAAEQLVGRSVDGWTAGFPVELAFDGRDPLLAIGMNGEPLPPRHGFPARLIVPGLYGYVSATKWIEEIELTTWDGFDGYWIPRGWAKEAPIKTQSRIDHPRNGETISESPLVLAGVAWAPTRGIEKVEVQLDEGDWVECELTDPLSDRAWVQWKTEVAAQPGKHQARVRATDGTGVTQTAERARPAPDGATGYHIISFELA